MPRFWKLGTILQNNNPYGGGGSGGPTSADLVTIVPAGNITSINVQNAIYELDSKKEPAIVIGTSVQYWRGDKTWQTLDKTAIGLSNVPNLDTSNPVNITQDATHRFTTDTEKATWNAKEDAIIAGTTSQYWRGDKTWQTLDKTSIGLSNVPNLDTSNPANISQDTTHRFVTDNEKATWNADIDVELITQASHGFSNGQAVYLTSGGVFVLADSSNDTKLAVGIVTSATLDTFLLMRIGTATVTSHGLSPIGETFYQSQTTPGALTTTKPITGIVSFIGIIKDANTLLIGPIIHSIASTGTLPWGSLTGAISNQTDLDSALNAKQNSIGYTPENITNKSADGTLSANSDTLYPSQKAVKTYADTKQTKQTPTSIKTSTYTASSGDIVLCDISSGAFTVNLPASPTDKSSVRIKLIAVNTTNRLTIACSGTDCFNIAGGPTVKYLHIVNEAALFQYQSSTGIWFVLSTDAPLEGFATNFPGIDAQTPISASDISIDYTTRVLTITPPLGYFYYFTDGGGIITRHIQTGNLSFPAFTDTSGIWYFYLDSNGVATTTQTKWTALDSVCTIYRILWNATLLGSAKATVESFDANQNTLPTVSRIFNERYGTVMAITTSGVLTSNALGSGAPNADGRNAVVGMANINNLYANLAYTITNSTGGLMWQQDLGVTVAGSLNATNSALFPIRYQDGAGLAYTLPATRFPFDWNVGTNDPNYITATGTRTPVSNNYYFVYYIYAFQDPRNGQGVRSVSAPIQYATITDAQANVWSDIQTTYPTLNDPAIRPMYRLIYEHKTTFDSGSKQSVLREVEDLRIVRITAATATTGIILAASVVVSPVSNISSTNVQSALAELDSEKCANPTEGTYTPTLSNTTNVAASTAYQCSYTRIGNTVFVWGKVDIDPTAAVATLLGISLPIASNLGVEADLGGTASCRSFTQSAGITADITNDIAQVNFIAADISNRTWDFNFNYRVI